MRSTFSVREDKVIIDIYVDIGQTPEWLVARDCDRQLFLSRYRDESGDLIHDDAEVCHRIFNLRRSRHLPRLGGPARRN